MTGRGGAELQRRAGRDGARAYLGITVPGFPNLFCVYGPNTNLGGSSIIGMLEAQAGWVAQAVRAVADGARLEVRREVADAYDREMQERGGRQRLGRLRQLVPRDGGRITTNWPGLVAEYVDRTARLDPADFEPALTSTPPTAHTGDAQGRTAVSSP